MSQELEHKVLEEIFEIVKKYDFKESAPSVVTALAKIAGAVVGRITGNAASPNEAICKEACRLLHLDIEKIALRVHTHTATRHKEGAVH